jgi:hypothetical protein
MAPAWRGKSPRAGSGVHRPLEHNRTQGRDLGAWPAGPAFASGRGRFRIAGTRTATRPRTPPPTRGRESVNLPGQTPEPSPVHRPAQRLARANPPPRNREHDQPCLPAPQQRPGSPPARRPLLDLQQRGRYPGNAAQGFSSPARRSRSSATAAILSAMAMSTRIP